MDVLLVTYLGTVVVMWPALYLGLYRWQMRKTPAAGWTDFDRFMCTTCSAVVAAVWPLAGVLIGLLYLASTVLRHLERLDKEA